MALSKVLARSPAYWSRHSGFAMPKWGLLQRLSGRSLANSTSPSQVLQGSCKHTNGMANDAKNGLVDVAEETVGTLQEVVEVDLQRLCLSLGMTAAMLVAIVSL